MPAASPFGFPASCASETTSRSRRSTRSSASSSSTTATSGRRLRWPCRRWRRFDCPHPIVALRASADIPPRWGGDVKLTFMGTAGARFMVAKQIAASGGLYLEEGNTRISLDPGPGAVVQYAKRKVDLTKLDAIVISHRHLDHCNDVNVMIEAMTDGGFRHRGRLFCPGDALDGDPVVLNYLRHFPQEIVRLQPETEYSVNGVKFTTSPAHLHQVETFGFRFGDRRGWVTAFEYYEVIADLHKAGVFVINFVHMQ